MNELTVLEQNELAECELVIERGLKTFVEVGGALLKIRDANLYRLEYGTFEEYCQDRWNMQRRHAYRLIDAAIVVGNVSHGTQILPTTERQVRPLAKLAPETQPVVWQRAVETAPNGKVTAAHVQSVVDEYMQDGEPELDEVNDNHRVRHVLVTDEWGHEESYSYEDVEDVEDEEPVKEETVFHIAAANHAISDTPGYDGDEWYTPEEIIEAARMTMGSIDLDPASCLSAQEVVKASSFYTKEFDSLRDEVVWTGNVWLNPPYSMPLIKQFVTKLICQYRLGFVNQAVILVNNSSDTSWFHSLLEFPVCFTSGRLKFWRPNHDAFGTRQGQAVFYLGEDIDNFSSQFGSVGKVLIAYDNQKQTILR